MDASRYSAVEVLRDGRKATICSLRAEDRDNFTAAVGRTSVQAHGVKRSSQCKPVHARRAAAIIT